MEPHTEQHLDKLVERVIKSSPLESPSKDFTANIMSKIETASVGTSTVYKPLISKAGLVVDNFGFSKCVCLYDGC